MYKRFIRWPDDVWQNYVQILNRKYVKKINRLIKSIQRNGFNKGLGKPEPLKGYKVNKNYEVWSRRINKENRLVYLVDNKNITILSCQGHYDDK